MVFSEGWRGLVVSYNIGRWVEVFCMSESEGRRRSWYYYFFVSSRREIGIRIDREVGN